MPNQPATPNRVVRVDDDLWEAGRRIAGERGETMSDYVRRLIREDVRRWPNRADDPPSQLGHVGEDDTH